MIRSIKALGLALVAVFAMSAVASSAAQAEITFTGYETPSETHVKTTLEGSAKTVQLFSTGSGGKVECEKFEIEKSEELEGTAGDAKQLTVFPKYADCKAFGLPATVTFNGCDYRFTQPTKKLSETERTGKVDLFCPKGKAVEIHVYSSGTPTEHSENVICTITVEATQTTEGTTIENMYEFGEKEGAEERIAHVIYKNTTHEAETPKTDVDVNATVEGIHYEEHGALCPDGNTVTKTNAKYSGEITVKGKNAGGAAIDVSVSGE